MNKALPKTMEETKRGLEFLHISDNMPRQSGTIAVARRPPMPAPLKEMEREPKVQVTPCQEDRRDEACVYTVDAPGTRHTYDVESAAATLAIYIDLHETHHDAGMHADDTYKKKNKYDEEVIATDNFAANDEKFVAATLAVYEEENVAVHTLATNNKETNADTLAIYDEESATLASYDEEFAIATLAAYDEETAAVEGEPWGA
jgi:hypothetical protein